jgi:anti-sigma regulatory factor (Ser/Thr protein kinase)
MHTAPDSTWARLEFTLTRPEKKQAALLSAVDRFGHDCGLGDQLRFRLKLIVDELVSNCIFHGQCRGRGKQVKVKLINEPDRLLIEIIDPGCFFDPTVQPLPQPPVPGTVPPVGGLGLCLVRRLVDSLEYRRDHDRNHLLLSLKK